MLEYGVQSNSGMTGHSFIEQVAQKLQNTGHTSDWHAQVAAHQIVNWLQAPPVPTMPTLLDRDDLLDNISNTRLIHEMLKRGFAVMKIKDPEKSSVVEPA